MGSGEVETSMSSDWRPRSCGASEYRVNWLVIRHKLRPPGVKRRLEEDGAQAESASRRSERDGRAHLVADPPSSDAQLDRLVPSLPPDPLARRVVLQAQRVDEVRVVVDPVCAPDEEVDELVLVGREDDGGKDWRRAHGGAGGA